MSATERLYYRDSHLLEFDARVIDVSERDDGAIAVTLDRTAFYPTGGGQPNDTGTLGEARVVDCIDAEEAGVLHVIQGLVPQIGDTVHGQIDSRRRLDHLQQHTGQHILSAAFVRLFDAPTHSFRVLEHECEIDVALDDPTDEKIEQAVDLANQTIWQNLPIKILEVTAEAARGLPLRKEPARAGELRVIEISDFDLTPCGGTHANGTGEVGVIAVRGWERAKGLTRIQFMAGLRVVDDYRKANRTATETSTLFSAGRDDSPALVARLIDENKKLARRVRELDAIACRVEAEEMIEAAIAERGSSPTMREGSTTIIAKVFDDRDADSLKHLALALINHPNLVALLASRDGDTARLVFARANDATGDMNALMRKACQMIDGRGGGKPDLAQGGGKNIDAISEALDAATRSLSQT
ncbi:MAG TPA: DHHA1 domain-containing protein [Pyrinomonadaceae bacterium]|nr:DHHA1 domain-containing protein [Pyrinomonadaceae bacterium]